MCFRSLPPWKGFFLFFLFISSIVHAGVLPAGFAELRLANGLDGTTVNYAPDGRLFVTQKKGIINIIKNGALLPTPFLDLQSSVDNFNERGLQSLVFDPDFATNGFIYIYYTRAGEGRNRVSRITANGDVALAGSETLILNLDALPGSIHNGGALFFKGGKLFVTTGDGSNSSFAQSFASLLGKVLRINKDGTIPTDNPFYSSLSGNYRMIYAMGFRNPFRSAVQAGTERVFVNDVGGNAYEEINDIVAGKNYGWPIIEGKRTTQTPPANYMDPIFAYSHADGCAIGGGAFYNPATANFPAKYVGKYFFGDYCGNWIKVLDPATGLVTETFETGVNRPISFSIGDNGDFYYLSRGGLGGGSSDANTQSCCSEVWRVRYTNSGIPTISAQPVPKTIVVGGSATFVVGASGDQPLTYQWQRNGVNIPGANNYIYEFTNATLSDNGAQFRAVITNPLGTVTSNSALLTVTSNLAPQPVINAPTEGVKYVAGTTLVFSGSATDPEDGTLPAEAFTWEINFHHGSHSHPGLPPTSGITGGTFSLAANHDPATDVWYRIYLTVRDSDGQETRIFRDVHPVISNVTLATNHPNMKLLLDGTEVTTPHTFSGVAGIIRNISAPTPQVLNGTNYDFLSWSDGGNAQHAISTPATASTFTATYFPLLYEAEAATLYGATVRSQYIGFTGSGFADYDLNTGGYVEWVVNVPTAGNYILNFRYANGGSRGRPLEFKVNNAVRVASFDFPSTVYWNIYTSVQSTQQLNAGNNIIRLTSIGYNGPILDHLTINVSNAPQPPQTVSTPTFSPAPGTYSGTQSVSLSTSTTGAQIYYTLDGATPTTSSTLYSGPLSITSTTTVKAIATKAEMTNSAVATGLYTINTANPPATPVQLEAENATLYGVTAKTAYTGFTGTGFADYGGTAGTYIQWTINLETAGTYKLDFRYANGSLQNRPLSISVNGVIVEASKDFLPTGSWSNWTKVTSTVNLISGVNTIRATSIGFSGANVDHLLVYQDSTPTPTVSTPTFTPAPGTYSSPVSVSLATSTVDATIYYTTNGATPTLASAVYTSPILTSTNTTIKAIAAKSGHNNSAVATGAYLISGGGTPFEGIFETENASLSGVVVKFGYGGWTGTGYGDYINSSVDYINWQFSVPAAGNYVLQFKYALISGNRPLRLQVNGNTVEESLAFPGTGSWSTWANVTKTVALVSGTNTVRLTAIGFSGGNFDFLKVNSEGSVNVASLTGMTDIIDEEEIEHYLLEGNKPFIEEEANETSHTLEMYPIPVKEILTVKSHAPLEFVRMVTMTGAELKPGMTRHNETHIDFDVTNIRPGMCLLMLKVGNHLVSKKILISE